MNRIAKILLDINSLVVLEKKTLTSNDKNLQLLNVSFSENINKESFDLMLRYKQIDGKIFADVYSIENDMDIQIPNSILSKPQTLIVEFCFISKENDDRITIPRRLILDVLETYDNIIEQDDVIIGQSVADIVKEIPQKVEEGIKKIETKEEEVNNTLQQHLTDLEEKKDESIASIESKKLEVEKLFVSGKEDVGAYIEEQKKDIDSSKQEAIRELSESLESAKGSIDSEATSKIEEIKGINNTLSPEIESIKQNKFDKSGGKISGMITVSVDNSTNNSIRLEKQGSVCGSIDGLTDGISIYNAKSAKMFKMNNNGNTRIDSANLTTNAKEVIASINELKTEIDKLKQQIAEMQK